MKHFLFLFVAFILFFASNSAFGETSENYTEGELKWSQLNYRITNGTGTATIIVEDPDMNIIPSHIDTLFVYVHSDTYPEGIVLELYETEKNSGVFERTFTLSETRAAPSILHTVEGDTATAKYIDDTLPMSSSSDVLELKATTLIGHSAPPLERVPASSFQIKDNNGNLMSGNILLGQQIRLDANLANQYNRTQDFAYFILIHDEREQAVSLSWIQGTLMPLQKVDTSQSWIPNQSGVYTATAFVWESLNNPSALSPPLTLEFVVSEQISQSYFPTTASKTFEVVE